MSYKSLVIDIGNTNAKAAIFVEGKITKIFNNILLDSLKLLVKEEDWRGIIISDVSKKLEKGLIDNLKEKGAIFLSSGTKVPFKIDYDTPHTLGPDRIAAIAGAVELRPGNPCLVIDAGTCIKFDFIDQHKVYRGGSISPGIDMRFKALNAFTGGLPMVEFDQNVGLIGKSTKTCLQSGVLYGVIAEIDGVIGQYSQYFDGLNIIICGGNTNFFESKIKGAIFAVPHLVLLGLNGILEYNIKAY